MDLNWFESFLYGLFSGLTDILPVSAEAHRILMLKCFGIQKFRYICEVEVGERR